MTQNEWINPDFSVVHIQSYCFNSTRKFYISYIPLLRFFWVEQHEKKLAATVSFMYPTSYTFMTQSRVTLLKLKTTLCSMNKCSIQLFISSEIAQFGEQKVFVPNVAESIPLWHSIFRPTKFVCWHTSLQLKTNNQNDWSVQNKIEQTFLTSNLEEPRFF